MALWVLALLAVVCFLAAIMVPNFMRARARGMLTACKSNLKNIGIALDMYAQDHEWQYPVRVDQLTPKYLKSLPVCPSVGRDTYSATYLLSPRPAPTPAQTPGPQQDYTFRCAGGDHANTSYPAYSSVQGLIERP